MSDYWKEYGKKLERKPYICPHCGRGSDVLIEVKGRCDGCRKGPKSDATVETQDCSRCGEKFLPFGLVRRSLCPDCSGGMGGAVGAERNKTFSGKLRISEDMSDTGESRL